MSRLPLYVLALILAIGLIAPATSADDEPAPAPVKPEEAEKPKDEEKPAEDEAAGTGEPEIKIVEAGAEPRKALRFKPTPGSKLITDAHFVVGFNVGGMGGEMDITATAEMTIEKGAADAQYKLSGTFTKVEMKDDPNNPMAGQLKPMIDGLKGVTFEGEFNEHGKWVKNPGKNLGNVSPMSGQFAPMLAIVFGGIMLEVPTDAIGAGGSWTDKRDVTERGTAMKSSSTYKVETVEGDRVSLSFTTTRSAENQKTQMMGMEVTVLKATGKGSGTLTLDLGLGVASTGTLKMEMVQETDAMGNMENSVEGKQTTKAAAAATTEPK